MKFIKVEGSDYEIGFKQGREVKEDIPVYLKDMTSSEMWKTGKFFPIPDNLIFAVAGRFAKFKLKNILKKTYPHHFERISGMAEGAETSENILYFLNLLEMLYGDVRFYLNMQCTAFLINSNGNLYAAKNYDFPNFLGPHQIVRISYPKNRYATLSLTQSFIIGNHNGINEHGLTILYTYATPKDDYKVSGIPLTIHIQEALEICKTTEEALEFLKNCLRGNGANLGIIDANGKFVVIELSRSNYGIRNPEDGIIVHTNHYLHPEMVPLDIPDDSTYKIKHPLFKDIKPKHSSYLRYKRALELLEKKKGNIEIEDIKSILRDHGEENFPSDNTICRHAELWGTLGSVIFLPKEKKMLIVEGNPCKGNYKEYKL
jgi:predicted choloylglycine hydrolase